MIKKKDLSQEDKKAWDDYILNPSDIYDKDNNFTKKTPRKYRLKFDLHGFTLDDANKKVRELIFSCSKKKYREILLITGKGAHSTNSKDVYSSKDFGLLKHSVPEFIKSDEELSNLIISVSRAENKDGGEGAIIIKLKRL